MIFCVRVSWKCHLISYISHPMLCSIAFKLKYYFPGTRTFSILGTGRVRVPGFRQGLNMMLLVLWLMLTMRENESSAGQV